MEEGEGGEEMGQMRDDLGEEEQGEGEGMLIVLMVIMVGVGWRAGLAQNIHSEECTRCYIL